eukprot:s1688_g3.t1
MRKEGGCASACPVHSNSPMGMASHIPLKSGLIRFLHQFPHVPHFIWSDLKIVRVSRATIKARGAPLAFRNGLQPSGPVAQNFSCEAGKLINKGRKKRCSRQKKFPDHIPRGSGEKFADDMCRLHNRIISTASI